MPSSVVYCTLPMNPKQKSAVHTCFVYFLNPIYFWPYHKVIRFVTTLSLSSVYMAHKLESQAMEEVIAVDALFEILPES